MTLKFEPFGVRCREMNYAVSELTVSIVVPFHNEWPSVLLRTVYSVVNRTPRNNLREILLVDDNSNIGKRRTHSIINPFSVSCTFLTC